MDDFLQPFIQEAITIAQFEDTLEKRNKEIKSLKEEVVKLKEELHNVKTRNKKLCNILALGESKHIVFYLIFFEAQKVHFSTLENKW
jgi:hypothetical protein